MVSQTAAMRKAWAAYECQDAKMKRMNFGPDSILVAPGTEDAWRALEHVLRVYGYEVRIEDTDSYNCRTIKSGRGRSLHSYGIALDINWHTNPYHDHSGERLPRFSAGASQGERAQDVKLGKADTDMTRAMVDATLAIRTKGGERVFAWGGDWRTLKDSMHFQIEVTPEQLANGIDWSSVEAWTEIESAKTKDAMVSLAAPSVLEVAKATADQKPGVSAMGLPAVFFDTVRVPLFGGSLSQSAVDNIDTIVDFWLRNYPSNPLSQLAYVLATVLAEVGADMRPVRETFAMNDAQARQKLSAKPYAQPAGSFGHAYYGRGYVQLTHLSNYKTQSQKLGIDLVQFPDRALETPVAIHVLVNGMMDGDFNKDGFGLAHYVNATQTDFVGARRTVNLQDRAGEIAGYAVVFNNALKAAQIGLPVFSAEKFPRSPDVLPGPITVPVNIPATYGAIEAKLDALIALFGAYKGGQIIGGMQTIQLPAPGPLPPPDRDALEKINQLVTSLPSLIDANGKFDLARLTDLVKTIVPSNQNLTPVNSMLGQTIGGLLDGRKTAIGVAGSLLFYFLGGANGNPTAIAQNAGSVIGPLLQAAGGASPIMLPLTAATTLWGILGKIDKWVRLKK